MRSKMWRSWLGLGVVAAVLAAPPCASESAAQEIQITESAVTLSSGSGPAELWIRLSDGGEHRLGFDDGSIEIDGAPVGAYDRDGTLASAWRRLLRELAGEEGAAVRSGLLDFREVLAEATAETDPGAERLKERIERWLGIEVATAAVAADAAVESAHQAIEIAPGRRFDFTGALSRLESALERLGDIGDAVDDELAMIVHDDFSIPAGRSIAGDLALLSGTLRLGGEIEGDVLILDGTLVLADGARVKGDILQVGGELAFDGEVAVIEGEILSDLPLAPEAPAAPPTIAEGPSAVATPVRRAERDRRRGVFGRLGYNFGRAGGDLMEVLSALVGLGLLGLLLVRFSRGRLETVADTVRHEFARSFAMGVAGGVLFFPALLILLVLVITWPIVPFFVLACILAAAAGFVAVAHGAGEMFARKRYRYEWLERLRRSNSYYYVLSGLVILLLPFAAAAALWVLGGTVGILRGVLTSVAGVATMILVIAGFGSVLLTRAGSRSIVVDWGDAGAAAEEPMEYASVEHDSVDEPAEEVSDDDA